MEGWGHNSVVKVFCVWCLIPKNPLTNWIQWNANWGSSAGEAEIGGSQGLTRELRGDCAGGRDLRWMSDSQPQHVHSPHHTQI